jgi:Flp pilus assembly protein TadD
LLHLVQTADDLGNNQLAVDLLDRIAETTDMPAIDFGRARHHYRLEHYEQALRALEQYSARMGDGPGTLQLRADIMTGLERTDEVRHAWLGLMKYYPELDLLPWDYHEVFQPQHAQDIADAAGRSQQPRLAACHIASRLILLGRAELVEPLAVLARSTDQTYPELLVLEGALLEHQGDSEGNIEMLRRAMDLAGPEHQEYGVWLYDWAWALFNLDRAAEAVRLSPDPAMTFADLALDEGDVYVDRETLRQLTEALNESQPANQSAVERRLLWIPLATGLNHLQHGRYEDAWTVLSTFRSQHQNPDDPLYSDDTAAAYMVPSWLAEAAVKSGHAVEAYKTLRDDEGRFGLLAYVAEQQELADVLDQIIDLQRQESVDDDEVTYYEGVSFELRKQYEQAISKYMDYLNGDEEVRYKDYRAGTRLARLAWRESAWDLLFERLTADQVVSTLGDLFQQRNRADLMQQLLERGQTAGVDDEIIRPHRTWMLHQQQNWAALIEDYQKWLAAGAAQQEGDSPVYLGTGPYISHYVDALIADNRLTELEQLMATLEETSGWSRWFSRARVVQSTSDQYLESTEGDDAAGVLPLNHVQDHPSTAANRKRQKSFRQHLNQLDPAQDDLPVMTVLFQTAAGAVPLQCRLRKWDTRGQYRTMTVELPDDVLVAPDSRGEWHQLSIEQFLDWSE